MRVAVIAECFTPSWNGVTNSVLRIVRHLEAAGHDALVVAPGPGPDRDGRTPVVRVPGVEVPMVGSMAIGLPWRVERHLAAFDPDIVHLAAPVVLGEAAGRAAHRLGLPIVASYQTDVSGFARRYGLGTASGAIWAWLRHVHGMADLTLAPSSSAEWDLRRHGIGPVARWGRGVDLDLWRPSRQDPALRNKLLGPGRQVLVGYSGRLAHEKRIGHLANLRGLPGVGIVVIGDGPARGSLQRALPEVEFLGYHTGEELARRVASLDVFVHTGPHETFCQAVQEALAAGVPVVAPASGGPLDLVTHGVNGWLYPADDPPLLRQAVEVLAGDPLRRAQMGAAARRSVEGRTWARVGEQLIGHYRSVLDGPLRGRRAA